MSFEALVEKVRQAETALEAKERQAAADWRQLKATWIASWTPGRIVVAGLVRASSSASANRQEVARGGGACRCCPRCAGLFAGGSAQAAAGEAEEAAETARTDGGRGRAGTARPRVAAAAASRP